MDLQLLKTFLEVAATGSFGAAAGRLFVTQSAVSLRVQRLEDELNRPLFERSNGGVVLTSAGREFRGFATMILRNWDEARQRIGAMDGMPSSMVIGAQGSLWPRFGFDWLDQLRAALPEISIRAELGANEALYEMLLSGAAQAMLCFEPINRPGLVSERLMQDRLIMVSPWADASLDSIGDHYAKIDWGPDFCRFHDEALPQLAEPKLELALGALSGLYLAGRPLAAYLPERYLANPLTKSALHPVKDAPSFTHTAWVVWREDMPQQLRNVAARTLFDTVAAVKAGAGEMFKAA